MREIKEAMVCRNLTKYHAILSRLKSDNLFKAVEENIRNRCPFYCEDRRNFIGLGTASVTKIANTIGSMLANQQNVMEFVLLINEFAVDSQAEFANRFTRCADDIDMMFNDPRLRLVRECYEVNVVTRFV